MQARKMGDFGQRLIRVKIMRNLELMLCLVMGILGGWAAAQDSVLQQAAAFQLIEDAVAKGEIPGAVVLVAQRGKIVREAAYGLSDIENHIPFRADTVCWLASVTKPVTTAAIMTLVEEGKVRLDDPVEKYIPEFQTQRDKDGRHHAITIRQLLTHTAGLPADPPTRKDVFDPEWRGKSVAETVGPIAQATLQFVPGTKVQYSNAGFYVLGRIIEIASGWPYADYVKEKILDPLGMKEAFYPRFLASVEPRRLASVYRQRQGQRFLYFRYEPGMATRNDTPDGGLFCTARDLFKFCQMFLDNDGRILSKESVRQMLREQAPGRGLGWALENGGFAHAGSSGAYAWGDPHTGVVAILLIQYNDFRRIPRLHAEFIGALRAAGATSASETNMQWQETDGVRIPVPPAEHPRLYLRAEHVAQLPQRLKDPALRRAVDGLQAQARRSPQAKVEWDAIQYLVTHNEKLGRAIIEAALPLLQKCELATRQDACRETGRMMVTGAIVYDWCYKLLTPEEKQAFIKELVRLAQTQECGYPPTRQGSVTGHSSEAMIMRDMLSAGIAIYDEFPEMYRLAAGRFFREHLPARNWFYPGHAYHQGDSYGPHRYSWDTYPLWIFDRLGAGNVYNPEQHFVPYLWIYTTRPDGQRLRAGDTFACSTPRGRPWSQYIGTVLTASYYNDGILLDQYERQGGSGGNETIFEVLWRDTALAPKSIATLPLSWYSGSPFGWVVARTGWDANAVIAEMKVNEYNFTNHQHLDAGAFQIYYKGALAIDSGVYQGGSAGGYGSTHCLNYSWRTIAHNSLLVYDPNEKFGGRGYGNDGGQRLPHGRSEPRNLSVLLAPENGYRTGQVLAHGFGPDPQTPDFTLLQGDLTEAYGKKVRQVTRSFVFLNLRNSQVPAALVVFDRVVSADPAFRKYWLLHTLEEPRVDGTSAVVDCTEHGNSGRLVLNTLLPAATDLDLTKVGGPGKEYWVFGQNWPNDIAPERLERTSIEPGAWRIEVSPKAAAAGDLFLNVMQVTDRQSSARWPVRVIEAGERVGCLLEGPDDAWTVLMRRDNRRSAEPVKFTVKSGMPGDRTSHVLITDLSPGQWDARQESSGEVRHITVGEDSGAAWFEGPAGTWTLSR
jgi:CubicO group peptidase (beta-lactamase class C family)